MTGLYDESSDTYDEEDEKKTILPKAIKAKVKEKADQAREAENMAMQQELMDIEVITKTKPTHETLKQVCVLTIIKPSTI